MEDPHAATVAKLRAAASAYYNTSTPLLSDAEYDALLDTLPPSHPYRNEIRAPLGDTEKTVPLPYLLPSLDKVKPGMPALTRFLSGPHPILLSDKLDGISALYDSASNLLTLGGDGRNGVPLPYHTPYVKGTVKGLPYIIRGELILPKASTPADTLGRSYINGLFHQKMPSPKELAEVHFVAYEILNQGLTPRQQFNTLSTSGFIVPFHQRVVSTSLSEKFLSDLFLSRREKSPYVIDGIVLTRDLGYTVPTQASELKNPKHSVAFKMPLADQCADTTVVAIIWQSSRQGFMIPRIQIQPVKIGGSTYEYLTGHHASFIKEHSLGPGAKIRIRKSGDIIPILDTVYEPASEPSFPPEGTYEWNESAVHILSKSGAGSDETQQKQLLHFFKTLDVAGVGPGTVKSLWDAGFRTPGNVLAASSSQLKEALGPTLGQRLYDSYRSALASVTDKQLILASSLLPRGFGEKKLDATASKDWPALEAFQRWKLDNGLVAVSQEPAQDWKPAQKPAQQPAPKPSGLVICFTGFRDKDLKAALEAKGHHVSDTLTKKTTHLIIPDAGFTSSKTEKRSPHIALLTREQATTL